MTVNPKTVWTPRSLAGRGGGAGSAVRGSTRILRQRGEIHLDDPVIAETNGALVCTCAVFQVVKYCDHLGDLYRNAGDVVDQHGRKLDLPPVVEVILYGDPLTGCTVYLPVGLSPREAYLSRCFDPMAYMNFLGFLHDGEGRLVLRDLVLAYITDAIANDTLKCASSYHTAPPPWATIKATQTPALVARNALHIIEYGLCPECQEAVPF